GALTLVSASVPTHQTAACWFVPTADRRFGFTTNTGSASISNFKVEANGTLSLVAPDGRAATTAAGPIDEALTSDGALLYALASMAHELDGFHVSGAPPTPAATH